MALFSSEKFKCARCGRAGEQMKFAPFPNELGNRVYQEICQDCWQEWMKKQQQLINHFGLDVSNPDSHDFLFDQLKIFLFNEGVDAASIDTSKEGSVQW
ncbi:MAG: oxidative damage protection protein [Pyrinomonadaceae bacterium]